MRPGYGERVLIVDGDEGMRQRLCEYLGHLGYRVDGVGRSDEALDVLAREPFAAAVVDVGAGPEAGRAIMTEMRKRFPKMPVVVMSGAPSVRAVIAALRQGAFDYIIKPYEIQDLAMILPRALARGREDRSLYIQTAGRTTGK